MPASVPLRTPLEQESVADGRGRLNDGRGQLDDGRGRLEDG
ncbi:hypothetical protein [Streptomyces sp. NPDC004324]